MARPLRIEYPGAVYHLTSRGNAGEPVFRDDKDRALFLDILSVAISRFSWLCHGYCLMDNHYHLLVETPQANLSLGMRHLNGAYALDFNAKHKRFGHLFQARFKAILVEKEAHLLELSRYVVLNPVRARMAESPRDWTWSSYRAMIGLESAPSFLTTDWVLRQFATSRAKARAAYLRFVEDKAGGSCPWDNLKGQIYLGSESFLEETRQLIDQNRDLEEIPKVQRLKVRPSLDELKEGLPNREEVIFLAYTEHGYRMREIAKSFGVHYSTVSRAIRRQEKLREGNDA